jgi:hypothetical protein
MERIQSLITSVSTGSAVKEVLPTWFPTVSKRLESRLDKIVFLGGFGLTLSFLGLPFVDEADTFDIRVILDIFSGIE